MIYSSFVIAFGCLSHLVVYATITVIVTLSLVVLSSLSLLVFSFAQVLDYSLPYLLEEEEEEDNGEDDRPARRCHTRYALRNIIGGSSNKQCRPTGI